MKHDVEKLAADWIAYARLGPDNAPEAVFADGWVLVDLVEDDPALAWDVIRMVVRRYPLDDYHSREKTDGQRVVALMAAGPIEDLLGAHGPRFIAAIEAEARQDGRMAWALGGVWQSMADDIWARVQAVADYSYWKRPATE